MYRSIVFEVDTIHGTAAFFSIPTTTMQLYSKWMLLKKFTQSGGHFTPVITETGLLSRYNVIALGTNYSKLFLGC